MRTFVSRLLCFVLLAAHAAAAPLGSGFTYQGELREGGALANGLYDLELRLFDAASNGVEVAPLVSLDAVPVADGRFTVALDFGAAAFVGAERYLQLSLRPDGNGAYTLVLPRQLLRATPEALRAAASASAPWSGLTGVPAGFADGVDNNAGGTVTSVGAGTGLTGGPITAAGTLSVDGAVVQLRVSGSCSNGQSISAINGNGTVSCVAGGGGGVTQVTAGAGLTGGTITSTGTIAVAKGGIASDMIADNAVGLAQVNTAQVQARITGSCAAGRYFRGIAANGTVLCELLPGVFSVAVADDPAPRVGNYLSIALGADGLPVIAHSQGEDPSFQLRVTKCNDVACSGNDETSTVVDNSSAQTGLYPSVAVGGDGLPVMAYRNNSTGAIWVAKCNDPACTGGNETRTQLQAASGFSGYAYISLALGADGLPVIAYMDFDQGGELIVAKCNDAACAGGNETTSTVDDTANVLATDIAMAIRANGLPLIVHSDITSATLRVVDCNDTACAGGNDLKAVLTDNAKSIGGYQPFALALGSDGLPAVAFLNATDASLRLAHCADDHCYAGTASFVTLDDPGAELRNVAMAIAADGTPIVAYQDFTNGRLKVVKCGTRTCQ